MRLAVRLRWSAISKDLEWARNRMAVCRQPVATRVSGNWIQFQPPAFHVLLKNQLLQWTARAEGEGGEVHVGVWADESGTGVVRAGLKSRV